MAVRRVARLQSAGDDAISSLDIHARSGDIGAGACMPRTIFRKLSLAQSDPSAIFATDSLLPAGAAQVLPAATHQIAARLAA
jgi:hypothetical protein